MRSEWICIVCITIQCNLWTSMLTILALHVCIPFHIWLYKEDILSGYGIGSWPLQSLHICFLEFEKEIPSLTIVSSIFHLQLKMQEQQHYIFLHALCTQNVWWLTLNHVDYPYTSSYSIYIWWERKATYWISDAKSGQTAGPVSDFYGIFTGDFPIICTEIIIKCQLHESQMTR